MTEMVSCCKGKQGSKGESKRGGRLAVGGEGEVVKGCQGVYMYQ